MSVSDWDNVHSTHTKTEYKITIQPEDLVPLAIDLALFWYGARKLRRRGTKIIKRVRKS